MTQLALDLSLSVSPISAPVWAFGGSRRLPPAGAALAERAALALLRSGAELVTGCCTGADACALSAACAAGLAARVQVCSAFGPLPQSGWPAGACPASAVAEVRRGAGLGASVRPWSGGPASVALSARLAARTRLVARTCNAGAVLVLAPGSRGALILARAVARRGLPVVALPVAGASLPELGGRWAPAAGLLTHIKAWTLRL